MGEVLSSLVWLRDHRLAFHASHATSVCLWRVDSTRIIWANAVGAAGLGAASPAELAARRFAPTDMRATQIGRLAATLNPGGAPQLQRLRGFGPGIGSALLCACSRIVVEGTAGFLIVAKEVARPVMPLAARVGYLLAGSNEAMAAFTPAGALIAATQAGRKRIGQARNLTEIGADGLGIVALADGSAVGHVLPGELRIVRIGHDDSTVLIASFGVMPQRAVARSAAPGSDLRIAGEAPSAVFQHVAEQSHQRSCADEADLQRECAAMGADPPAAVGAIDAAEPAAPTNAGEEDPHPLRIDLPLPDPHYPLRFVWQMDPEGRFILNSCEFMEAIGPRMATVLGRPWKELADELGLDPEDRILQAIASRETWSGINVSFPLDGSEKRLPVEMSGLPIYDRSRRFLGFRGFGVCRDLGVLAGLDRLRPERDKGERASALQPERAAPEAAMAGADDPAPSTFLLGATGYDGPTAARTEPSESQAETMMDARSRAPAENGARRRAPAENILPFPTAGADQRSGATGPKAARSAAFSLIDHGAFSELARQLQVRLAGRPGPAGLGAAPEEPTHNTAATSTQEPSRPTGAAVGSPPAAAPAPKTDNGSSELVAFLERLPVGFLVYRFDQPIYANPAFLETTGHTGLESFIEAGGLDSLFVDAGTSATAGADKFGRALTILTRGGEKTPVAARLFHLPWNGEAAFALMLVRAVAEDRNRSTELALRRAEAQIRELRSILDTAFDGVIVLAHDGRIVLANRCAETLFGWDPNELAGELFDELFAPGSRASALEQLDRLRCRGELLLNDAREVTGQMRQGQTIPLAMTIGAMHGADKYCVVFRDLTPSKRANGDHEAVEREADHAGPSRSEVLAELSHAVRIPLNSVLGFSDFLLQERLGPLGNEAYRGYLQDIRTAAQSILTLFADSLDLAKAESGTLELVFAPVDLNRLVQRCVKTMQAQASRERIIIRMSLSPRLPPVEADARALERIIANLLSNAIRLAGAGGQVIVSTGASDRGHVVLRVRDTGAGMSGADIETAMQPLAGAERPLLSPLLANVSDLPLTKALAEANGGALNITSKANDGTLVEVSFPSERVPSR